MPDLWSLIGWLTDALAELKPTGRPKKQRPARASSGNGQRKAKAKTGQQGARRG
jgi:hypothetical protein